VIICVPKSADDDDKVYFIEMYECLVISDEY